MFALALSALLIFAQAAPNAANVAPPELARDAPSQTPSKATAAETAPTALPIRPGAVVIRNSGSTNTLGFTIAVSPDGESVVSQNGTAVRKTLSAAQTREFFEDVRAMMPLETGPVRPCMRSVSFGSSTTVSYQNATTSDLSCRADAASAQLRGAIAAIVRELDVKLLPRQRMQE